MELKIMRREELYSCGGRLYRKMRPSDAAGSHDAVRGVVRKLSRDGKTTETYGFFLPLASSHTAEAPADDA